MSPEATTVLLLLTAISFETTQSNPIEAKSELVEVIQPCASPIYCQGELLDVVQLSRVFNDSKTFVDMSQLNSEEVTLKNFRQLMNRTDNKPTRAQVAEFVNNNFVTENETVSWTPTDFEPNPIIFSQINDERIKRFAQNIVNIWPTLGRHISPDVFESPEKHSIIPVPNGFIIPGGRFRELYYWDSYWIIKGLLISEMYDTARGMLNNFCYLINKYNFIPNGARLYYTGRSQPPLFTAMVRIYLDYTEDTDWLKNNIQCVETELKFWLKNRTELVQKDGVNYELAFYGPKVNTPRPESYANDIVTCESYNEEAQKRVCYNSLTSGAETGWDFSSRWFFDENGGTNTNLTHIRTQRVVPVDLNAFLCEAFSNAADFYELLGDKDKQAIWKEKSDIWKKSVEMVLYDAEEGIWFDYDVLGKKFRKYFYPSNFAPLWTQTYDISRKEEYGRKAAAYFLKEGIDQFLGGIPTSIFQSGEQWDLSNAWPPLQEIVILGLLQTGNSNATNIANLFAQRWISANMEGYEQNQIMFEKYDAVEPGKFGGGGEYVVQAGFGWTNGIVLSLIDEFYTRPNK